MSKEDQDVPLNAIRAFVMIARHGGVSGAARALGTTQSSVSRHLSVLEHYLGEQLLARRGRTSGLTDFGRSFVSVVGDSLDTVCFTAKRMRRSQQSASNRIVVRTSLSTFAYTILIPNLESFSAQTGGALVDVMTSMAPPAAHDGFDILLTRDLDLAEPGAHWDVHEERLVCVGAPSHVAKKGAGALRTMPILTITSRPDILPNWLNAMDLSPGQIQLGARYDHHYLALPAVTTGRCLLVAPEIIVSGVVRDGVLQIVPGSQTPSGMQYRAYVVDRTPNIVLARSFCRWLARLCRTSVTAEEG